MKKKFKFVICAILTFIFSALIFVGCSNPNGKFVVSIEQSDVTTTEITYTVTYSNGTTSTFTVPNATAGQPGRGIVSIDKTSSINGVDTFTITYSDETTSFFTIESGSSISSENDLVFTTAKCLLSTLSINSEFIIHDDNTSDSTDAVRAISTGSGVIYRMDSDFTYVLTNFHVIYNGKTNTLYTDGNCYSQRLIGYLYGSEGFFYKDENQAPDQFGSKIAYYGDYLEFSIVGGSVNDDIALIKVPTADVLAINENARAVDLANDYSVGQTAIAIGDANAEGIAVSKGIVSVDSEYIYLSVDSVNSRKHRLMRIDTVIYPGNSGCGLFNEKGELVGICNSGAIEESINYAIPIDVVKPVAQNLYYYHNDNNDSTNGFITCSIGITVNAVSPKYQYDTWTGKGKIVEKVIVSDIVEFSLAQSLGIEINDQITHFYINNTAYPIDRIFNIYSIVVSLRASDTIKVGLIRDGIAQVSLPVTITEQNFSPMAI